MSVKRTAKCLTLILSRQENADNIVDHLVFAKESDLASKSEVENKRVKVKVPSMDTELMTDLP